MASLNFVRGTVRGKLGQFVGSSWRGIHYIKLFGKPGNPRTAKQVAVRKVFKHVSSIAKALYAKVLKPYTFPKPRKHTAYNQMLAANQELFENKAWDPQSLKIFDGPLENPGIVSGVRTGKAVNVVFSPASPDGEGDNDTAIAVVYDSVSGRVAHGKANRKDGSVPLTLTTFADLDNADLHLYLAFSRAPTPDTGEQGMVSATAYQAVD